MQTMTPTTLPAVTNHLLRISDHDPATIELLLDLAVEQKADPLRRHGALAGRLVQLHFEKPSTRTRLSFAGAVAQLGGTPLVTRPDELQMQRGEPIADMARLVSRLCAAFVIRTFDQHVVDELARHATIPVVNALTDDHHPCQALADLMTLRERFGSLEGLTVAYVGDGSNVAASLIEGCAACGVHIRVATPQGYAPEAGLVARAGALAAETGGSVTLLRDPAEAATGAQAIYADAFVSMGEEEMAQRKLADLAPYRVDAELMAQAASDAIFLHCLPAHRGEEVTEDVIDGPQSAIYDLAENRMHTAAAVLAYLTGTA